MNKAKYPPDVTPDRKELLRLLEEERPGVVVVLGDVDTGKSTLVTLMANQVEGVAVVDSDIGQKGILPPATVSLAVPGGPFESLSELKPLKSYFIGSITPQEFFAETIVGVKRLVDEARRMGLTAIVDTTGYIRGTGRELKRLKLEALEPDFIVALQRGGELESIIRPFERKSTVVRLSVSENVRRYSREERKRIRAEKWRAYFREGAIHRVSIDDFVISGTGLFQGRELSKEEMEVFKTLFGWLVFHGEKGDGYTIVKAGPGRAPEGVKAIEVESLSNLLVGLIDGDGFCPAVGILKLVNFKERWMEILTPLKSLDDIVEVRFGRIRVREDGEELGLLRREAL